MPGDVIRWESHRGRTLEFDEIETGTATVWLNNRSAKYDPTNGSSPLSGKLLPLKQMHISAQKPTGGAWVPQFTGYIEDWDFERRGPKHAIARVSLFDGFEILSRAEIAPSMVTGSYFAAQHVDDRMRAALQDVKWPAPRTQINTGNVDLQATLYPPGTSALEVLRDAAEAEFPTVGLVFMKKDGTFRFLGRCARFNKTSPDWRLGDYGARLVNPTLVPIFDVRWSYEREHIYNEALIIPQGVDPLPAHVRKKQTSIDLRGRRSLPAISDLLTLQGTTTGNTGLKECTDVFAQYIVDNYSAPYVRPHGLELRASFAEAAAASYLDPLWSFMLNVEIGDLVELNTVHPGGGGLNALTYFVEGIHNYVEPPRRWRQTIDLSPKGRFSGAAYTGC